MPYIQQHKNTLKKSRPQLYNRRRVGGGGSDLSGSLLVFLGVWHLDRHNLHALRTRPKRNHNHNPEAWNHERLGISASAAGSFKISQTCRITVERGRWRVVKKRSHHASLRTPKIGKKYQINFWLASLHWIHSYPADLVNVVTGRIAPETVNTHDAVDIGNEQLISFEKSRSDGFCALFYPSWYWPRQVANFGKNNVHDTNLIYSRVLGLQRDEKCGKPGHSSVDCASFEYYSAARGPFLKFVDGAPYLAVGVREFNGIDNFFHRSCLLSSSCERWDVAALSESVPTGAWRKDR